MISKRDILNEIRNVGVRVDALSARTDVRFDALNARTDARFDALITRIDTLIDALSELRNDLARHTHDG